jgi:hypothetical protein
MNVFYTRMFFMHPSKNFKGDRLITENPEYMVATDAVVQEKLENDVTVEGRSDFTSLQERTLMQWFVEKLIHGSTSGKVSHGMEVGQCNVKEHGLTLAGLFNYLDEHDIGKINEEDLTRNAMKMCPEITEEVCTKVFAMMDLDEGGFIDREEFDIIMSGMTFSGQGLDGDTKEGKHLRQRIPKEELVEQRQTTSRLAKAMGNVDMETAEDRLAWLTKAETKQKESSAEIYGTDSKDEAVAKPAAEPVDEALLVL